MAVYSWRISSVPGLRHLLLTIKHHQDSVNSWRHRASSISLMDHVVTIACRIPRFDDLMVSIGGIAFSIDEVVRSYHIYKDMWSADIGFELPCYSESSNCEDCYAVAVMDDTHVVGHVPRKISFICCLFLSHSGVILCRITGSMQYSRGLIQGRLDVPCQ